MEITQAQNKKPFDFKSSSCEEEQKTETLIETEKNSGGKHKTSEKPEDLEIIFIYYLFICKNMPMYRMEQSIVRTPSEARPSAGTSIYDILFEIA